MVRNKYPLFFVVFSVIFFGSGVFSVSAKTNTIYMREVAGKEAIWKVDLARNTRTFVSKKDSRFVGFFKSSKQVSRDVLREIPVSKDSKSWLVVPRGYRADIIAGSLERPRVLGWDPAGRLLVSELREKGRLRSYTFNAKGEIIREKIILDGKKDGATHLDKLHGFAFYNGTLYTASERVLEAWQYDASRGEIIGKGRVVLSFPVGGEKFAGQGHMTRTVVAGRDGKLYLSVGSNCDSCTDSNPDEYAVIQRFDPLTEKSETFVRGLRNTVFFVESKNQGFFYGNDMGQDSLGEELPPDEINLIAENKHYGWPYCYGDNVPTDKEHKQYCRTTEAPVHVYRAHSAPLGIRFIPRSFHKQWDGNVLVALHGSVIRKNSIAGYKITRVILNDKGRPIGEKDVVTGFIGKDNVPLGRPVDVIFDERGTLYITDDHTGVIHRIKKLN